MTLAEACQIRPPKREARERLSDDDLVSFLPMEDLGIDLKPARAVQARPLASVIGSYTYFADGDVLLAKITPCFENGKLGIAEGLTNGVGFGSSEFIVFRPRPLLSKEWLYYYLSRESFRAEGEARMQGAVGHKRVAKEFIADQTIPIPPLADQKRILHVLDEALTDIDAAQVNAEMNLRNARALYESELHALLTQRDSQWERVALGELLDRGWIEGHLDGNHGAEYPRKEEFISAGVPYISANCLLDDQVDMSRAKHLSPSRAAKIRKGIAKDGDVLFAHNATVGPVAILRTAEERVILGTSLTYYRCDSVHIRPRYLAHYMRSHEFKSQYMQVMKQSTRNQVPITKQREFFHVIPPVGEQDTIVSTLDDLFDDGRRLELLYQRKLDALIELRQSMLHAAFDGRLGMHPE